MFRKTKRFVAAAAGAALVVSVATAALAGVDWGQKQQNDLNAKGMQQFGVNKTLAASSTDAVTAAVADADPTKLITLANGLTASVVTESSGSNTDMMALWPNDTSPTHIVNCNEQGTSAPGVQRIDLEDGTVETIVTGTTACDPIRRTAWGTIVFGEEAGNTGQLYELIDPLHTTGVTLNRLTGVFSGGTNPQNLVRRDAVGRLSFEGLGILASGVLYYGDELRPNNGNPGGSYYKFIPTAPYAGGAPIAALSESPFASGSIKVLKLGKRAGNTDFGHGNSAGLGTWVPVCADGTATPCANVDLGAFSLSNKITGFYRPEDLEIDPAALTAGNVRMCANNTGNEGDDRYFGETVCITDGTSATALANTATPELQNFVLGNPQFAMMDNLAFQPGRNNLVINEDGDQLTGNNDVWDCLPDGTDDDLLSDGCVRIASLNDPTAETTGGIFDGDGDTYYVSIQHNITGHGVVLAITGWK
ncbi:MAG: alkaline phosphatase PhoX [Acidimicrobiia bacterium]